MTVIIGFIILTSLLMLELCYFRIADHYNIIDKPNHRSSHSVITIRGGGIIFLFSVMIFFAFFGFQYLYFFIGLLMITTVSFFDDILTLNNKLRLFVHLFAVALIFYQWELYEYHWIWLLVAAILIIGTINAYNFMDGINGIAAGYSIVTVLTLFYLNVMFVFVSSDLIVIVLLSLIVFSFFNFRKKAKCFAGDVGSVSMAFIIIFFMGKLILQQDNFAYVLLLLVYGLDVVTTVFFRLIRRENIFQAHRSHYYQFLSNEKNWSHVLVSVLYAFVQLVLNIIFIFILKFDLLNSILFSLFIAILFLILRFGMEGRSRLLGVKPLQSK